MSHPIRSPRKLIEVALPLDAINVAAAKEKAIRHGHPSTLHLWWARRPLAAARAVIFAQLVNDPGYQQGGGFKYGTNKKEAAIERKRLFKLIEDLVLWENTSNEDVLERARVEIRRSWREVCELNKDHPRASELFDPDKLPDLHDPFAGGGTIPLEAQRLGLDAYASDLNPVAVLINKATIEIPPKFAGRAPVSRSRELANRPGRELDLGRSWPRATGLAEDVRYYGDCLRDEARRRIGHLYPPVEITAEMAKGRSDLKALIGRKLPVIAWLWARTVRSPNPAFSHIHVPLVSTFILSTKEGRESYVKPIITGDKYRFEVEVGTPPSAAHSGTKLARANFGCLLSGAPIDTKYIRSEASEGRMSQRMLAVVVDAPQGRLYLSPTDQMERTAESAAPKWKPDLLVTTPCHDIDRLPMYGMFTWGDAFTQRQLVALTTITDLVPEIEQQILKDALTSGMENDGKGLEEDGVGATAYAQAVSTFLALALGKAADYNSSVCTWINSGQTMRNTFGRQAIPMVWDYAEANPIGSSTGSYESAINQAVRVLSEGIPARGRGIATQADAQSQTVSQNKFVSTDPPYYDNIGYADLSDFFYVWLRKALRPIYPGLMSTIAVPKDQELIAAQHRHGGKKPAEAFFMAGMTEAMERLASQAHPEAPVTIYYAFKQSETRSEEGTASTGWETFLEATHQAGLSITATWPIRTEWASKVSGVGNNMLASSIVLACRRRPADAVSISRREFLRELNVVLPDALDEMTKGSGDDRSPVAPVDLSQAIIGPGMAVFSKYSAILEADGSAMSTLTALQLINRFLAEDDFDSDTQFCLHWFETYGWSDGRFGDADLLSRAKGTSVEGVKEAGVIDSGGGVVRLKKWAEYPSDWDPASDTRNPVWETLHHLIRALKHDGEAEAGRLLAAVKGKAEAARQLAYRLYTLCERQGWSEDARGYNELITSWSGIEVAAGDVLGEAQSDLFA